MGPKYRWVMFFCKVISFCEAHLVSRVPLDWHMFDSIVVFAPAGMDIEGLSDDDMNPPDVSGLNFDHLNLSSRLPVRSAVTINEHLPQDVPSLDDILQQPLQIPQSTGASPHFIRFNLVTTV